MSEPIVHLKVMHRRMQRDGELMFVNIEVRQDTFDTLEAGPMSGSFYALAANAVCAKFKKFAGKKYFDDEENKGRWPDRYGISLARISYEQIDPPRPRPSTQQRAKW